MAALDRVPPRAIDALKRHPRLLGPARSFVNRAVVRHLTRVTVRSGACEGLTLVIDPTVEKFYWTGWHEPHLQKALDDALVPGATFWDVGAHIGFFCLQASRLVGPDGEVVAFEPVQDNLHRLEENLALNGITNVTASPLALSDAPGEATMLADNRQRANVSSLMWTLDQASGGAAGEKVQVTTLDEYAGANGIPDLVKIDAESAEVAVLRGGTDIIASGRTSFIVEFMSDDLLAEARDFMPGYEFALLEDNHYLLRPAG